MSAFDFFAPRASHSWKFTNPGATHTGTITEVSDARLASAPSGLLRTDAPAPSSPLSVRQCTRQAQAPSTLAAS